MTLLIKNVQFLVRTPGTPERGDVFISGGKISAIGSLAHKTADEVIDGQGAYLSPGFIDLHSEADHHFVLWENPRLQSALGQGITTILGGQGGVSLAPVCGGNQALWDAWAGHHRNIDWAGLGEMWPHLKKLGVNFATLTGLDTLRWGAGAAGKKLQAERWRKIQHLFQGTMRDGAFGLSLDLNSVHQADLAAKDLKKAWQINDAEGGILYADLKRGDLSDSLRAVLSAAGKKAEGLILGNLLPRPEDPEDMREVERALEDRGLHFEISPFAETVVPIYRLLPTWAQRGNLESIREMLRDEWLREKISKDLEPPEAEEMAVIKAGKHSSLLGLNLKEIGSVYGIRDMKKVLLKLMLQTDLRALVAVRSASAEALEAGLRDERSLIGTGGSHASLDSRTATLETERDENTFPRYLEWAGPILGLEEAVRKISAGAAAVLGLPGRDGVGEGRIADLACFSLEEEGSSARIKFTIVGGELAWRRGEFRAFGGRPLLKNKRHGR